MVVPVDDDDETLEDAINEEVNPPPPPAIEQLEDQEQDDDSNDGESRSANANGDADPSESGSADASYNAAYQHVLNTIVSKSLTYSLIVLINAILLVQGCSQTKLARYLKDQYTSVYKECCPETLSASALISRFDKSDLANDGGNTNNNRNNENQNQPTKNDTVAVVHISDPELCPEPDALKTTIMAAVHVDSLQNQAFDDDNDDSLEDEPTNSTHYALRGEAIKLLVVGNKIDLGNKVVPRDESEAWARSQGMLFL